MCLGEKATVAQCQLNIYTCISLLISSPQIFQTLLSRDCLTSSNTEFGSYPVVVYCLFLFKRWGHCIRKSMLDASAALWSYAIASITSITVIFCRLWWVLYEFELYVSSGFLCMYVCVCVYSTVHLSLHALSLEEVPRRGMRYWCWHWLASSCVNIALYVQCHAVEDSCDIQHHGHWPLWSTKTVNETWYIHTLVQSTQRGITVNVSSAPNLTFFLL